MKKSLLFAALTTIMTFGISMTALQAMNTLAVEIQTAIVPKDQDTGRKIPLDGGGYMEDGTYLTSLSFVLCEPVSFVLA